MSLTTQVFPILSPERDSPCDHKMADVAQSTMSSQAGRKGMEDKGSSLMPLLSKRGAFQEDHSLISH